MMAVTSASKVGFLAAISAERGHLLADLHGDGEAALEVHGHGWFLSSCSKAARPMGNATGKTANRAHPV
jgi:hypothetical protein